MALIKVTPTRSVSVRLTDSVDPPDPTGRNPVARWTEVPTINRDNTFIVTLSAEHSSGIEKVTFTLDDGVPVDVFSKTAHPDTGYEEYLMPVPSDIADGEHEVTATITANSGDTLVLSGPVYDNFNLDYRNNGFSSFFFWVDSAQPVRTVGPSAGNDYATLDDLFEAEDPRGMRVICEGNTVHTVGIVGNQNKSGRGSNLRPVEIVGEAGCEYTCRFAKQHRTSLSFQNITFNVGNLDDKGNAKIFMGDNNLENTELSLIDCVFRIDPVQSAAENLNYNDPGWHTINDDNFFGGVYSVNNYIDQINRGPLGVTLSKGDSFNRLTWDHLPQNPAGVFNFFSDRSTDQCANHDNHTDLMQYYRSFNEQSGEFAGEHTRNRMFCDVRAINFYAQVAHFEGTQLFWGDDSLPTGGYPDVTPAGFVDGERILSEYHDFFFARWEIDSHNPLSSMNLSCTAIRDWSFVDMTFRNCTIDVFTPEPADSNDTNTGGKNYEGMFFDKIVTTSFRMGDRGSLPVPWEYSGTRVNMTPDEVRANMGGNTILRWWVEEDLEVNGINVSTQLSGVGPVTYANPEPPTVETECNGVVLFSDSSLVDLTHTTWD